MKWFSITLVCLTIIGCGEWTTSSTPPKPEPVKISDASDCVREYAAGIADAFDAAATSFEQHEPSIKINEALGDSQKAARLKAFTPLMAELNKTRPASNASESEREAADIETAALLRKWASQIRGAK